MKESKESILQDKLLLTENTSLHSIIQRSEVAQEIVSGKSGFIEKWALFIFVGILLLILIGAWFIKYPDFINAPATLTAMNAPKEIIPRQDGRLVKLFVRNNQDVKKGEMLAWIESTADHMEVLKLSHILDSSIYLLNSGLHVNACRLFTSHYDNLGEIQQEYQRFVTELQLFYDYTINGFYSKKRTMLENDFKDLNNANKTIEDQKDLTERDLKLAEETYKMNKALFDEKILSKEEFRQMESKYLNRQMTIPQLDAALSSNAIQARDKLKELNQLKHDMAQQVIDFRQALQSLKSSVDEWKKKFVLQSPIDGKVSFIIRLQENQYMKSGMLLGYINPEDAAFYADAYLPQSNFGKIYKGLKVQLRFDAYPYQEVGYVDGTLDYISNIPSDSGFLSTIKLEKGLVTTNNVSISYRSGLKAQAIVITKDMPLLKRLWYKMNNATNVTGK